MSHLDRAGRMAGSLFFLAERYLMRVPGALRGYSDASGRWSDGLAVRVGAHLAEKGQFLPPFGPPSYHDLHVTLPDIPRTRLFDLPYDWQVQCNRVSGWEVWRTATELRDWRLLAGEYAGENKWLVLDVAGHVILDSRLNRSDDEDDEVS